MRKLLSPRRRRRLTLRGDPAALAGERVGLRLERSEDADALAQGFADDASLGAMIGIERDQENAEWLRTALSEDRKGGVKRTVYRFVMVRPHTIEVIGEISLTGISWPSRRARLGILVLPGFRRAGVGREAVELLVDWAQRELGLHRIELHTAPENAPMQGLAQACGFTREGILQHFAFERGHFVDNVVYARLPG
jgi:RimJ/RimL family protein N-acetyltransferase